MAEKGNRSEDDSEKCSKGERAPGRNLRKKVKSAQLKTQQPSSLPFESGGKIETSVEMVNDAVVIALDGGRSFRLRVGTKADIPELLDLTLSALEAGPDELYNYNFPFRHAFTEDHRYYWQIRLQALLYIPSSLFLVAEHELEKAPGKKRWEIIAWAMWTLNSASGRTEDTPLGPLGDTWGKWLGRGWMTLYQRVWGGDVLSEKRMDIHRERYKAFMSTADYIHDSFWAENYPENIQLSGLNVAHKFQRQGYGTALVRWGVETFAGRGIPIGVESTRGVKRFYNNCGFEDVHKVVLRTGEEDVHVGLYVYLLKTGES